MATVMSRFSERRMNSTKAHKKKKKFDRKSPQPLACGLRHNQRTTQQSNFTRTNNNNDNKTCGVPTNKIARLFLSSKMPLPIYTTSLLLVATFASLCFLSLCFNGVQLQQLKQEKQQQQHQDPLLPAQSRRGRELAEQTGMNEHIDDVRRHSAAAVAAASNPKFARINELEAFLDDMNHKELQTVASGQPIKDLFQPKAFGGNLRPPLAPLSPLLPQQSHNHNHHHHSTQNHNHQPNHNHNHHQHMHMHGSAHPKPTAMLEGAGPSPHFVAQPDALGSPLAGSQHQSAPQQLQQAAPELRGSNGDQHSMSGAQTPKTGLMGSHSEQQIYSDCALILQRTYVKNMEDSK